MILELIATPFVVIIMIIACKLMILLSGVCSMLAKIFDFLMILLSPIRVILFLWLTCRNRGADHGVAHAFSVMRKALRIRIWMMTAGSVGSVGLLRLDLLFRIYVVMCASLLHDVKDKKCRKYRPKGTAENYFETMLTDFISTIYAGDLLMQVIDNISHSKEMEMREISPNGKIDWIEIFRGDKEVVGDRHAVSDADRLCSLGKEGHLASCTYNSSNPEYLQAEASQKESVLYDLVDYIYKKKLISLYNDMETVYAQSRGKELLKEFEQIHIAWGVKLNKIN